MERKNMPAGPSSLDRYINKFLPLSPWADLLERSKEESERSGTGFMSLSRDEVYLLKKAIGLARPADGNGKWVEIGALTGYTALSMLEALGPKSCIITMEKDPARVKFLEELFLDPRLAGRIQVIAGDSRENKKRIEVEGPFEGIFIDGAKSQYLEDLKWAETNVVQNGLIIADNIFLRGEVLAEKADHFSAKQISVMTEFLARIEDPDRFQTLVLPTSDGMSVSRKLF